MINILKLLRLFREMNVPLKEHFFLLNEFSFLTKWKSKSDYWRVEPFTSREFLNSLSLLIQRKGDHWSSYLMYTKAEVVSKYLILNTTKPLRHIVLLAWVLSHKYYTQPLILQSLTCNTGFLKKKHHCFVSLVVTYQSAT